MVVIFTVRYMASQPTRPPKPSNSFENAKVFNDSDVIDGLLKRQRDQQALEPVTVEEFQELAEKHRVQPGQP